jgi:peptide/nickel transport system substrate-binding protein
MIGRRTLLAGVGAALAAPAIAQDARARVLRFVPQTALASLDPIWTTASVTTGHAYYVFDTLYGVDDALNAKPQMAEGHTVSDDGRTWLIRLRPGLVFHDGEPVRAQDCAASLARWSKRDSFGQVLAKAVDAWEAVDDRTIRIRLNRRFPPLLDALAKPTSLAAFVMPERLAKTDANTQVTDMVGSGPYVFLKDEFVSGSRVAYRRFDKYQPRPDAAQFTSGGKQAFFERVEWQVIPDAATAAAALRNNEVDWWEYAFPDLIPTLQRPGSGVTVATGDPLGYISILRFNSSIPPFNNQALRQAVLSAVDQADYQRAVNGESVKWRYCAAMFPCGAPHVHEAASGPLKDKPDLDRARAAVKAAGYNGERVVIINPGDFPSIAPLGEVTADLLKRLGMNVDLQTMDWGTVIQRRTSKAPQDQGGWNIFHTWTNGVAITNPAVNYYIRGLGQAGWFGWYENPRMEQLTEDWLNAGSDADQDRVFDAMQKEALTGVPIITLGQYFPPTAYRSNLKGVVQGANCYPWNVQRA